MLKLSRVLLSTLSFGLGAMLAILGLMHLKHFDNPNLVIALNLAYIVVLAVVLGAFRTIRIPAWLATIAFLFTVALPLAENASQEGKLQGDYGSWYVTGMAILFSVIAVRGYQVLAAIGAVILFVEILLIAGVDFLPRSGITGAELLVLSCIAISVGLDRASRDIENYQKQTIEQQTMQTAQQVAIGEHETKLASLISRVTPTLQLVAKAKTLSAGERAEIIELDQQLRDELSGGDLITDGVRAATIAARGRGVEVVIADTGGARSISRSELNELLDIAITAIDSASEGDRVRLTAPANAAHAIRLTISRPGVVTPSLDLKLGEGLV